MPKVKHHRAPSVSSAPSTPTVSIENDEDMVNVVAIISGERVVFGCTDEAHADDLKNALEECAWFQIETARG